MSKSVCYTPNPLIRDGMSGSQRKLPALDPSFFKVDERKTSDLLVFAASYAEQLKYFNRSNVADGDWTQFILADISTRIALITITDLDQVKEDWEDAFDLLLSLPAPTAADLELVMNFILNLGDTIQNWKLQVKGSDSFNEDIANQIRSSLQRPMKQVIAWSKGSPWGDLGLDFTTLFPNFDEDWYDSGEPDFDTFAAAVVADSTIFTGATDAEKIQSASTRLKLTFRSFHEVMLRIVAAADAYLQETLATWPDHKPHQALFISFLLLFRHAQAHINTLTQRHLDFYYREVLRLAPKAPVPDQVHLVFELAKNATSHQLLKDTRFKAGKDGEGKDLFYTLDENFVINTAKVDALKTVFTQADVFYKVWAAPTANSADGEGGKYADGEEERWPGLGNNEMPEATLGMAFASPVLKLAEGLRNVTLTFKFEASSFDAAAQNMQAVLDAKEGCDVTSLLQDEEKEFLIYFTTAKEWTQVAVEYIKSITWSSSSRNLVIQIELPQEFPAIVGIAPKVHTDGFATEWPTVKLLLNNDKMPFTYGKLRNVQVETITAKVVVTGVKSLVVQNDYAVLDASKNFQPFGPAPAKGSNFYIGNQEVFSKELDSLTVNLNWANLPPGDFDTYYKYYTGLGLDNSVNNVTVRLDILDQRVWKPLTFMKNSTLTDIAFPVLRGGEYPADSHPPYSSNDPDITIELEGVSVRKAGNTPTGIGREEDLAEFKDYNTTSTRGFIRLQLTGLNFGHDQYPNRLAEQTLKVAKETFSSPGNPAATLPNKPYTPELTGISIDYTSTAKLDLRPKEEAGQTTGAVSFSKRVDQFFHVAPYGQEEVHPQVYEPWSDTDAQGTGVCMALPVIEGEGQLYVGLKGFQPDVSNSLSLLAQVSEGSGNPDLSKPEIIWSYLVGNTWKRLRQDEVTGDTSNGFATSGIISFTIPREADNTTTLLPGGLHWLRAHVESNSAAVPDFLAVAAQASIVTFDDQDNAESHLATALAAETISNMEVKEAEVKTVTQPYASFGGKMQEADEDFYVRVSERLRHKDRGINIWDYETLVLSQFPQIYKVKCLNHSNKRTGLAPGCVYLVVIPSQENRNSDNLLEPRASVNTLDEISKFILKRISPFVKLEVRNPTYEQIRVEFNVKFRKGEDEGFSLRLIQDDIKKYLSPWAYAGGKEISFEGKIHASVIVNFIEELSYVDYITEFKMFQVTAESETGIETVEAVATTPMSILVSASEHIVTSLGGPTS